MANRINLLNTMIPFIGVYYSMSYVRKNVLHLTEEEIEEMNNEMVEEQEEMMRIAEIEAAKQQIAMGTSTNINSSGAPPAPGGPPPTSQGPPK